MAQIPGEITIGIGRLVKDTIALRINIKGVRSLRTRLRAAAVLFKIAGFVAGVTSAVTIEVVDSPSRNAANDDYTAGHL